jgi:two-component system sensor histidine kinase CiaH
MNRLNRLRLNLTVMNTAVLIGLSIFIAVVFYAVITINRNTDINGSLEVYCAQLAGDLEYIKAPDKDAARWKSDETNFQVFQDGLAKNNVTYAVWNERFDLVSASQALGVDSGVLKSLVLRYLSEKQSRYWVVSYKTDEQDLRICTYTIVDSQGALQTVQVVKNMASETSVITNAVNIMLIVIVIGAVASGVCGYFLSGRALVPIKQNSERQQEFLADASHELRTPIAVIQTNLEVVKASGEETVDSQMEWIDNAYQETRRMHRIVEDLMFLARADAGEVRKQNVPVDLEFLCREVAERMMPVAMNKSIILEVLGSGDPVQVDGDESQLTQLLVILVDNAIKYSGPDTRITLDARLNGTTAVLAVSDQGIGIPEGEQQKVFQRFYRVDKARSRAEGGTGLGLSIAQWIVRGHKGSIGLTSQEGVGTTIEVRLPALAQQEKEESK